MSKNEKNLLLNELLRNSKQSDRQLAKAIGASQPTVTRHRNNLEEEGFVLNYSMVPDLSKLGYTIQAFTFLKQVGFGAEIAKELLEHFPNIVCLYQGQGLGSDWVLVTIHENYGQYDYFLSTIKKFLNGLIEDSNSFIVNLCNQPVSRSFNYAFLAPSVLGEKKQEV